MRQRVPVQGKKLTDLCSYTVRRPTQSIFSGDLFGNKVLQYCIAASATLVSLFLFVPGLNDVRGAAGGDVWVGLRSVEGVWLPLLGRT